LKIEKPYQGQIFLEKENC